MIQKHEIESKFRNIEYELSRFVSVSELNDLKSRVSQLETELQNLKNEKADFAQKLREAADAI